MKCFADAWPPGVVDTGFARSAGLPFLFVQAYQYLPRHIEEGTFRTPCPKICIATLDGPCTRAQRECPLAQLSYMPYGLDRDAYRLVQPIANRPLQVTMLYNSHPAKGARFGIAAIAEVQRRLPDVRAVVFSNKDPETPMPDGITFVTSPSRQQLVEEIYNRSRVFICSSIREGFGLCAIEAMAGGCALVTTDNGGSDDYAIAARPPSCARRVTSRGWPIGSSVSCEMTRSVHASRRTDTSSSNGSTGTTAPASSRSSWRATRAVPRTSSRPKP